MVTAAQIKAYIQDNLACDYVQVEGDDGQHFQAVIVSAEFTGQGMVKQHQLVYKALGDRMGGEIHALSMKTFTPEDWRKLQAELKGDVDLKGEQ